MHKEVLSQNQQELLPIISSFKKDFGLVGGTAIALHLGHRESIDFDLFINKSFKNADIIKKLKSQSSTKDIIVDKLDELTVVVNKVKMTFFFFPFPITFSENFENFIMIPDLLTLAAMKAYALGRRHKWKDYVDLFFIFKQYPLKDISDKASEIFKELFNERLFREQLCYFDDMDYSEKVDYVILNPPTDEEIKTILIDIATTKI